MKLSSRSLHLYYALSMKHQITMPGGFLNGKLLITGHTGFKGTWLALLLEQLEVDWAGISLAPKNDSIYNLVKFKNKIEEYFIDIRNHDALKNKIIDIKPKYVIHMAAQPLVLTSYLKPRETFETNVSGTYNLLDSIVNIPSVEKVAIVTTDKVYQKKYFRNKFVESDALGGMDPYSWSKVGAESATGAWQQISKIKSGPRIISLRSGNVIGGGDRSEQRLLPDLISAFISNSSVTVRNPESTRPWQHVLDVLYGYLLALKIETNELVFNFAPQGKSLKVRKVVEIASKTWGYSVPVIYNKDDNDLETKTLSLNARLARKKLGWKGIWNQEAAVVSTVQWWKNVSNKRISPNEACLWDIQKLLSRNNE